VSNGNTWLSTAAHFQTARYCRITYTLYETEMLLYRPAQGHSES
jgi:hypothetical protein